MRIAVIGAGGVGGYFGAKLAQAGNDVAFVARGAHLAAMRANGLARRERGRRHRRCREVVAHRRSGVARAGRRRDVLRQAVGRRAGGARRSRRCVARGGVVIPFQNGIDSRRDPARACSARARARRRRLHRGVDPRAGRHRACRLDGAAARRRVRRRLADRARRRSSTRARAAGVDAELAPDIRRALWEKFVFLNALSGLTCLARQPLGVVRSDPELRATFEAAMRETIAVAATKGVAFAGRFRRAAVACARRRCRRKCARRC